MLCDPCSRTGVLHNDVLYRPAAKACVMLWTWYASYTMQGSGVFAGGVFGEMARLTMAMVCCVVARIY